MLGSMLSNIVANMPADPSSGAPVGILGASATPAPVTTPPTPPPTYSSSLFSQLKGMSGGDDSALNTVAGDDALETKGGIDYGALLTNLNNAVKVAKGPSDPAFITAFNAAIPALRYINSGIQPKDKDNADEFSQVSNFATAHSAAYPSWIVPLPPQTAPLSSQTTGSAVTTSPSAGIMTPPAPTGASQVPTVTPSLTIPSIGTPSPNPISAQGILGQMPNAASPVSTIQPVAQPGPTGQSGSIPAQTPLNVNQLLDMTNDPEYPAYQSAQTDLQSKLQAVKDANTSLAKLEIPDDPAPQDYGKADIAKVGLSLLPALLMRGQGAGSYLAHALQGYQAAHNENLDTDDQREYQQNVAQGKAAIQNATLDAQQSGQTLQDITGRIQQRQGLNVSIQQQQAQNAALAQQEAAIAARQGQQSKAALYMRLADPKMDSQSLQGVLAAAKLEGVPIDPNDPLVQSVVNTAAANDAQKQAISMLKINQSGDKIQQGNLKNALGSAQKYLQDFENQHGGIAGEDLPGIQNYFNSLATQFKIDPDAMPNIHAYESIRGQLNAAQIQNLNSQVNYRGDQDTFMKQRIAAYPVEVQKGLDQVYGQLNMHQQQLNQAQAQSNQALEQKSWQGILNQATIAKRMALNAQINAAANPNDPNLAAKQTQYGQDLKNANSQIQAATDALKGFTGIQNSPMDNAGYKPNVPMGAYPIQGVIGSGPPPGSSGNPANGWWPVLPDVRDITPSPPSVGVSSPSALGGSSAVAPKVRKATKKVKKTSGGTSYSIGG